MKKTNKKSITQVIVEINTMIDMLEDRANDDEMPNRVEEELRYLRDKLSDITGYDELHEDLEQ